MNMWGDRWGPYGPPELTVDRIRRYEEAGAETVIVRFASFDQERQVDRCFWNGWLGYGFPEFS